MDLGTRPFVISQASENTNYEYLGSDGFPITVSHEEYLEKCAQFRGKARKYARDNEYLKKSLIHHEKIGYDGSDEWEILFERDQHKTNYEKAFNYNIFDENSNSMYECFTGKGKRIRIIRELGEEERIAEFSEDFDDKRSCWISRYCILSRFIQIARVVIVQNRLKKNLNILKSLTPEMIYQIERTMARERGELVESIDEKYQPKISNYPCSCNALKERMKNCDHKPSELLSRD